MTALQIFDPTLRDPLGTARGGGRVLQTLRENFPEATFISELTDLLAPRSSKSEVGTDSTLLVPFWKPFEPPVLNRRIASRQLLFIYDVIPLKYSSHFPAGLRGKLKLWQNKRALKFYDGVLTISEASKKEIVKYLGIDEDKVHVIYPTTSRSFFVKKYRATIHDSRYTKHVDRFAIYVGDVNWNKNLVNLARAIKLADVTCLFVGSNFSAQAKHSQPAHPWLNEYTEFLKLAENDGRFVFLGAVDDQELINLYQKAVCNILVSRDEGFGLSYLEAATQKCPSVLSDIPVFHEIARDTALFAESDNPQAIADQIKQLFENNSLRNEMGDKAHARVLKLFNPEEFRKKVQELTTKSVMLSESETSQ